jgi:hypothetical protein
MVVKNLDSLFAERVLKIPKPHFYVVNTYGDMDFLEEDLTPYGPSPSIYEIKRYTRSLDAVWEATGGTLFCCRTIHGDFDYIYKATVVRYDGIDGDHTEHEGRSTDHPAEALVLACLRAVGVTEEELEQIER